MMMMMIDEFLTTEVVRMRIFIISHLQEQLRNLLILIGIHTG